MIKNFDDLLGIAKEKEVKTVAVAGAHTENALKAIKRSLEEGLITPILVGREGEIKELAKKMDLDISEFRIIDEEDDKLIARKATELVSSGEADILMKGLVATSSIMSQVLDKEIGLRTGRVISQTAVAEVETYHKLLFVTDPAMNIAPDLKGKKGILENAVELAHSFGIECPKVAVLSAVEKVNEAMESTVDAKALREMNENGGIEGCQVYGPLALDNAISKEAAKIKGIKSDVAGDADIILMPEIVSGNVLYKSLTFLAGGKSAGIILGTKAPVVLTSRSEPWESMFNSIVLAIMLSK